MSRAREWQEEGAEEQQLQHRVRAPAMETELYCWTGVCAA